MGSAKASPGTTRSPTDPEPLQPARGSEQPYTRPRHLCRVVGREVRPPQSWVAELKGSFSIFQARQLPFVSPGSLEDFSGLVSEVWLQPMCRFPVCDAKLKTHAKHIRLVDTLDMTQSPHKPPAISGSKPLSMRPCVQVRRAETTGRRTGGMASEPWGAGSKTIESNGPICEQPPKRAMTHLVKSRRESQEFWLRPAKAIDPLKSDNLLCPLLDSTF